MKHKKRNIITTLISVLALFTSMLLPSGALALGQVEPEKDDSTLTVKYHCDEKPAAGVTFSLYRVGDISKDASLTLAGDFKKYQVTLGHHTAAEWRALAQTLAGYAQRDKLTPFSAGKTDQNGTLKWENLSTGLYLVIGSQYTRGNYVYTAEPFLTVLPSLNEDKTEWNYHVTVTPKYASHYQGDPGPTFVSRRVLKVWDDAGNEQSRPDSVTVELLKNGAVYDTVTLNNANSWRYTWENLSAYDVWTVVEQPVMGYTVSVSHEGATFVITNTAEKPEMVSRTVKKVWEDAGNEQNRPDSVTVELLKNGAVYDTVTLNDANGWAHTWEKLSGADHWTIAEQAVPGYTSSVSQNGNAFVIINRWDDSESSDPSSDDSSSDDSSSDDSSSGKPSSDDSSSPSKPNPDDPSNPDHPDNPDDPKLPQTGMLWWPVFILLAVGLVFMILGLVMRKIGNEK